MKKEMRPFEGFERSYESDYKLQYLENEVIRNYKSTKKWLYLGADCCNKNFAKIGITEGDLSSRSYSSARPSYYLFCAFKFCHNISEPEMKSVENDILLRIDALHRDRFNNSKRLFHYESGRLSECFEPVDFFQFYKDLHSEIINHHRNSFVIVGYEDESGGCEAEFVDCIFNPRVDNSDNKYIKMILQ